MTQVFPLKRVPHSRTLAFILSGTLWLPIEGIADSTSERSTSQPPQEFSSTPLWADEFNIDGIPDPANWTYERGFVRNRELQFYQPDNARVKDGFLIIEARREPVPKLHDKPGEAASVQPSTTPAFTSASLISRGLREWQYGRFELRARIDVRSGLWPAWWTLGVGGEWPSNGEIDIMEYYRGNLYANVASGTTARWKAKWDSTKTDLTTLGGPAWAKDFHIWRMDWTKDHIRLYVDGQLLNETAVSDTVNPDGTHPFRQAHYMILNLAVGGDNGGDPSTTEFPARLEVDWVRVYPAIP